MLKSILSLSLLLLPILAFASAEGSTQIVDGRIKIQFFVEKDQSLGSFALCGILEKHGFENKDGFVRTGTALAPLELYNYLYENGHLVFTIFLPVEDSKLYVSFTDRGFTSFEGVAAQRLFDVVKLYLPKREVNNIEQYKFGDFSFCDRTIVGEPQYRCIIQR